MKNMAALKQEVSFHCLKATEKSALRAVLILSFGRVFNQSADDFSDFAR